LKELKNFVRKYSLTAKLLIFKYRRQNLSVAVTPISAVTGFKVTSADQTMAPVHRAREILQLLTHETSDVIVAIQ